MDLTIEDLLGDEGRIDHRLRDDGAAPAATGPADPGATVLDHLLVHAFDVVRVTANRKRMVILSLLCFVSMC